EQERLEAMAEWTAFEGHLERTYGVAEGQSLALDRIQRQVPADAALVGWLDYHADDRAGEHWAVVVRSAGPPRGVPLPRGGLGGRWTKAERGLGRRLAEALADRQRAEDGRDDPTTLADALAAQRLTPLAQALAARDGLPAVRRLVVLPSSGMRGVPVGLLT